jgi:ribosome modulation factor
MTELMSDEEMDTACAAWRRGHKDFLSGLPKTACPFKDAVLAEWWLDAWQHAQAECLPAPSRLRPIPTTKMKKRSRR